MPYQRISVVGTSGSGKTTFAQQLGQRLNLPHIELDALHWDKNWTEAPAEVFRDRVEQATQGDYWVVDGNYSVVRDLVWQRADTVVWLNYSLPVTFARSLRRTIRRVVTQEELWSGNRESFRKSFCSPDSILLWVLKTYRKHRKTYPRLFQNLEARHLTIVELRSPKEAETWLKTRL